VLFRFHASGLKMTRMKYLPEKIALSLKSVKLLRRLMRENPRLEMIISISDTPEKAERKIRKWAMAEAVSNTYLYQWVQGGRKGCIETQKLRWKDYATLRILDYIDNTGREFFNPYREDRKSLSAPFRLIWMGYHLGTGGAKTLFFNDMLHLFRQYSGRSSHDLPSKQQLHEWMQRWPSGLDSRIIAIRRENRRRIISILADDTNENSAGTGRFSFPAGAEREERIRLLHLWWKDYRFHLKFAIRTPELLNKMLDDSLDTETLGVLRKAVEKGMPIFVNPYYLSLLNTRVPMFAESSDLAIRHYILYSKSLVDHYGSIEAWEKEDKVEPGKPNAAGWILPTQHNIHRRYPEVAILIPDTTGRACGGLCASCQRMYDFQRGHLNFNLKKLQPDMAWPGRLRKLLQYFEEDSQLRDILITGGDALMSRDEALEQILHEVYLMASRKKEYNKKRQRGEKFAEIESVRLGTRLPVYLPHRVTPALVKILKDFREKAASAGIRRFVIQTHFESPMEITPEALRAVNMLRSAGWMIANQLVFTAAASRRGHTAALRLALNSAGIIPYYTFSVKGFQENAFNYAPVSRSVQEMTEEKVFGRADKDPQLLPAKVSEGNTDTAALMQQQMKAQNLLFVATDRNVINLPGVGKSMTFRTIGITRWGRRILEFDHDPGRMHSPVIQKTGRVVIIESKPVGEYLHQLDDMGDDPEEYSSIWGYSAGTTEKRPAVFSLPALNKDVTEKLSNFSYK
jgi:lysine 2,3-aminomutase